MHPSVRTGLLFAIAANVIWGVFPIFWDLLRSVPATELVTHRLVWAFAFSMLVAAFRFWLKSPPGRREWLAALRSWRTWGLYSLAAVLIASNWLAFLWAVTHDQVLLSSLGYYINPIFNVLLGVVVLGERLPVRRWIAVGIATIGVCVMTYATGQIPWVSFVMASSFAGYALIKKQVKLDAMTGLFLETLVLFVPAVSYLVYLNQSGIASFAQGDLVTDGFLILGGLLTLIPLAFFSAATQRVPLSIIGVLQYIGPTIQFFVGVFYSGEPLSNFRLVGFAFVWTGVAIFLLSRKS